MHSQNIGKYTLEQKPLGLVITNRETWTTVKPPDRLTIVIKEYPFRVESFEISQRSKNMSPDEVFESLDSIGELDTYVQDSEGKDNPYTIRQVLEAAFKWEYEKENPSEFHLLQHNFGEYSIYTIKDKVMNNYLVTVNCTVNAVDGGLPSVKYSRVVIDATTKEVKLIDNPNQYVSMKEFLKELKKFPEADRIHFTNNDEDLHPFKYSSDEESLELTLRTIIEEAVKIESGGTNRRKVTKSPKVTKSNIFGDK